MTGVLTNSPVSGMRYRTLPGGQEGFTNDNGEFQYVEGDSVIFSIGALEFPEVQAQKFVTPLVLADSNIPRHDMVLNIASLLLTLDTDGDASNGISIDYETASAVAQPIEFGHLNINFAELPEVLALVEGSGSVTTELVSASTALLHLQMLLSDLGSADMGDFEPLFF